MLGHDVRGGASQSSGASSIRPSASQREEIKKRKEELAAFQQRKEQQKLGTQSPGQATRPVKQPFTTNTMATRGQSDAEKQQLLQRRKELMRPPSAKRNAQQQRQRQRLEPPATTNAVSTTKVLAPKSTDSATDLVPQEMSPSLTKVATEVLPQSQQDVPTTMTTPVTTATPQSPERMDRTAEPAERLESFTATRMSSPSDGTASPTHREPPPGGPTSPVQLQLQPSHKPPPPQAHSHVIQQVQMGHDQPSHQEQPQPTPRYHHVPAEEPQARPVPSPTNEELPAAHETAIAYHLNQPDVLATHATLPPPLDIPVVATNSRDVAPDPVRVTTSAQPSPSRGTKQVRFADEVHVHSPQNAATETALPLNDTPSGRANAFEQEHGDNDDPMMDPLWSADLMLRGDVSMSEADELLSWHHKETTVVTDHVEHHSMAADSQDDVHVTNTVMETRTEETAFVHVHSHSENGGSTHLPQTAPSPHSPTPDNSSGTRVKMYVAKPPAAFAAGETPSPSRERNTEAPVAPAAPTTPISPTTSQRRVLARVALALVVICFGLGDRFYPRSPVSKAVRVIIRIAIGVVTYVASRAVRWTWTNLLRPIATSTCEVVVSMDPVWSPSAHALQSLVREWRHALGTLTEPTTTDVKRLEDRVAASYHNVEFATLKSIFTSISSRVADVVVYAARPFLKPLPTIDPKSTAAVEYRLADLTDAQQQLRARAKEILRAQEEWVLDELERMKLRRTSYASATKSILSEISKTVPKAVQDAKLLAVEHLHVFTAELMRELMASIQPKLDAYERAETEVALEDERHSAEVANMKLEETARLEILRVEMTKQQTVAELSDTVAADQEQLAEEVVFQEVDVMEIVQDVEATIEQDAVDAVEEIAAALGDTIDEAKAIAEREEAALDTSVSTAKARIEATEDAVVDELAQIVLTREEQLKREHDALKDEIDRVTLLKLERLEAERLAAQELAQQKILHEEAVLSEAATAQRTLDEQLRQGAEKLEAELVAGVEVAAQIEVEEYERISVESEVAKESIEVQVVEEVGALVDSIDETKTEVVNSVAVVERAIGELEGEADREEELIAAAEAQRLEAVQAEAAATLISVAAQVEQAIASTAGIETPVDVISGGVSVRVDVPMHPRGAEKSQITQRSLYDEPEFRHMVLLSVGFVALAVVTAFVLYPRWLRLAVSPVTEKKPWLVGSRRRRRRRSWQRPAEMSDSEPEEVTLLQTGSSSEDGLSESNEPEPEVVEFMSGGESPRARLSHGSRSRVLENERRESEAEEEEEEEEEEWVTPVPQRRAPRRRAGRT